MPAETKVIENVVGALCEPPPKFADRRWHWIARRGHGKEPFRWDAKKRIWWTGFGSATPGQAAAREWVYWAPIEEPPRKPIAAAGADTSA